MKTVHGFNCRMSKSAQIILIGLAFCMLFHVESKSMKIRKKRDADNSADTPSFLNELGMD